MPEATEVVDRQFAAFQARDTDAFLTFYAKDARIRQFDGTVIAEGTDGLRAMYGPAFQDSPQLSARILNRITHGAYVVDEESATGVNTPGWPSEIHAVVVYQVRDGLIQDVIFLT